MNSFQHHAQACLVARARTNRAIAIVDNIVNSYRVAAIQAAYRLMVPKGNPDLQMVEEWDGQWSVLSPDSDIAICNISYQEARMVLEHHRPFCFHKEPVVSHDYW